MSPKISISAVSGAIVAVVMWLIQAMTAQGVDGGGIEIPAGIEAALTTIVMFLVGYFVPETWAKPKPAPTEEAE